MDKFVSLRLHLYQRTSLRGCMKKCVYCNYTNPTEIELSMFLSDIFLAKFQPSEKFMNVVLRVQYPKQIYNERIEEKHQCLTFNYTIFKFKITID